MVGATVVLSVVIILEDGLCILEISFRKPKIIFRSIPNETNQVFRPFVVDTVGENLFHLEFLITIYQVWYRRDVGWPNLRWS